MFSTTWEQTFWPVEDRITLGLILQAGAGLPDGLFSDQTWVNFGRPLNGKCWYILWPFGIIQGHLV
jgi:hypothetical protein